MNKSSLFLEMRGVSNKWIHPGGVWAPLGGKLQQTENCGPANNRFYRPARSSAHPCLPPSSPSPSPPSLLPPCRTRENREHTVYMQHVFVSHACHVSFHLQHLTYEVKPSFLPAAPGPDCRRRPANSQTCCHARLGGTLSSPVGGATAPRGALSRAPPPDWACPRWALNDDRDEPRRHEQLETPSTEAELQTEVPQPTEHKTGMH